MSWLKDIFLKFFEILNSLPTKVKCFYVGLIIFLFGGYFFYTETLSYYLQMAQIEQSQPDKKEIDLSDNKIMEVEKQGMEVERIYPKEGKKIAEGVK